jgi:hypothetical protein
LLSSNVCWTWFFENKSYWIDPPSKIFLTFVENGKALINLILEVLSERNLGNSCDFTVKANPLNGKNHNMD